MRSRLTVQKTINISEKMNEELEKLSEKTNTSVSELIRTCVERDLPKLRDMLRKRKYKV